MKEEIRKKINHLQKTIIKSNSPYLKKDYQKAINKLKKKLKENKI